MTTSTFLKRNWAIFPCLAWIFWASCILIQVKGKNNSTTKESQISDIKDEMQHMRTDVSNIASRVGSIIDTVKDINLNISHSRTTINTVDSNVASICPQVKSISTDISRLNSAIDKINTEITSTYGLTMRATVESLRSQYNSTSTSSSATDINKIKAIINIIDSNVNGIQSDVSTIKKEVQGPNASGSVYYKTLKETVEALKRP